MSNTRGELALKLEPLYAARSNQGHRSDLSQNSVKSPPLDTQKQLAKVAGTSHDTIAKVKLIAAHADEETKKTKPKLTGIVADFAEHLRQSGLAASTIGEYIRTAQLFLKHVGTERIDRISEADTRAFFNRYKISSREAYAARVYAFLKFAMKGLPAVINARGAEAPRAATKKELALKARWTLDKLIDEKEKTDDLVAKLARKLIDHYMYFEGRMKGEPENLDDVARFVDECRELIQSNLSLFMQMSAAGRNVHTKIDERVQ